MKAILVAGTGSWSDTPDWFWPGSPFAGFLAGQGVTCAYDGGRPFVWSTGLSGLPWLAKHREWRAGAVALDLFRRLVAPNEPLAGVLHSHALQVGLYAAADQNVRWDRLVSIGSPIRDDMAPVVARARARGNLGEWLHLHSDRSDRWQWFGELFDGHAGIVRSAPSGWADINDSVRGVGHSSILRDPSRFALWTERQWISWLRDGKPIAPPKVGA